MSGKSQLDLVTLIVYHHHKSIVADMEKHLGCGTVEVEHHTELIYQRYKDSVKQLEYRLRKSKPSGPA